MQYTNLQQRGPLTASSLWHRIEVYRQSALNQYRYEDDFQLATTRIGCPVSNSDAASMLIHGPN